MEKCLKEYKAIVWTEDPSKPGQRVAVLAESGEDAERQLREQVGQGTRMSIWNEEDANRIR